MTAIKLDQENTWDDKKRKTTLPFCQLIHHRPSMSIRSDVTVSYGRDVKRDERKVASQDYFLS